MTTTPTTAPETTTAKRGFPGLTCFKCSETGCIALDLLEDVTAENAFRCRECEAEFSVADVREMLDGWSRLLAWIDTAPTLPVED